MTDLNYIDRTIEVKIAGQDATGLGVNYVTADANGNMLVKDYSDGPVTPGTVASASALIGGQFNTALPTLTNTQQASVQLDSKGRLITSPISLSYFHPIYTTRIQTAATSNSSNSTTLTATIKSTQSGNLIVVNASSQTGTLTCSDSASQVYTTAVTVNNGGGTPHFNYTFYKANSASGVTSVTITDGSSTALNIIVSEYSNIVVTPLDKTQSNNGSASTNFTSNSTATTTQANELLIGCAFDTAKNNITFTAGNGWSSVNSIQNGVGAAGGTLFQEEQYVNATGAYTATGTISASDAYLATIATFEISSYPTGFTFVNFPSVIKTGPGTLASVVINSITNGSANVIFYDNTTNSGTVIANLSLTSAIGNIAYNLHFTNGLTMVVNSNAADFTVIYD